MGVAQLEPFVGQLPGLVPAAGMEGVLGEQEQRLDRRGDRPAFAAVLDGALEGLAALVEPVEIGDGDAGAEMRAGLICWSRPATEASARASMAGVRRAGSLKVLDRIARSSGGRGTRRSTVSSRGGHRSARPPKKQIISSVYSPSTRTLLWASVGSSSSPMAAVSSRWAVSTSPSPWSR